MKIHACWDNNFDYHLACWDKPIKLIHIFFQNTSYNRHGRSGGVNADHIDHIDYFVMMGRKRIDNLARYRTAPF